jgi:molybdenum cofactor biosynthesis enzyme MoaA
MGYVEILRGGPYLQRIENGQVKFMPSVTLCMACNDDRLIHDGKYLVCTQCHCRQ